MTDAPFQLHREMACTRAEFIAWLAATGVPKRFAADDVVTVALDRGTVEITLRQQSPRQLGAIKLPVLSVDFCFFDTDVASRNAFVDRFDLYTRRGGG